MPTPVWVKFPSDKVIELAIEDSDTIADAKAKVHEKEGVLPEQQKWFVIPKNVPSLAGKPLDGDLKILPEGLRFQTFIVELASDAPPHLSQKPQKRKKVSSGPARPTTRVASAAPRAPQMGLVPWRRSPPPVWQTAAERAEEDAEFELVYREPDDLGHVARRGRLKHVKKLVAAGGDVNECLALQAAMERKPDEEFPNESADVVRFLLAQPGIDVNQKDVRVAASVVGAHVRVARLQRVVGEGRSGSWPMSCSAP